VRRSALIAVLCLSGLLAQPAAAAVSSEVAGLQVALYRYGK
jgi:hypothetical protein